MSLQEEIQKNGWLRCTCDTKTPILAWVSDRSKDRRENLFSEADLTTYTPLSEKRVKSTNLENFSNSLRLSNWLAPGRNVSFEIELFSNNSQQGPSGISCFLAMSFSPVISCVGSDGVRKKTEMQTQTELGSWGYPGASLSSQYSIIACSIKVAFVLALSFWHWNDSVWGL